MSFWNILGFWNEQSQSNCLYLLLVLQYQTEIVSEKGLPVKWMRKLMYEQCGSSPGHLTRQSSTVLSPDSLARSQCSWKKITQFLRGRMNLHSQKYLYPGEHLTSLRAAVLLSVWSDFWVQVFSSKVLILRKWIIILLQHFWTWCSLYWFLGRAVMMWFRKDLDQNWNTTLPCGWLRYKCILQLWPPSKLRKSPSNI